MKRYSILIIAWYASITHVSEFIRNLKKTNPYVEISLLTSKPSLNDIPKETIENTSEIICFKYYSGKSKNRLIKGLFTRFYFIRTFIRLSRRRYDIVNVHCAKPRLSYILHWIKKISDHLVISPWGSDVFRVEDKRDIRQLQRVYAAAQYVTVGNDSSIGQRIINEFKVDPSKMVKLVWGGEFFDYIQDHSISITTEEAKARFGLEDRYVITCGYNAQRQQRHEEIIDAIAGVRNQLPANLTLLFPFTYGTSVWSDSYKVSIKKKVEKLGIEMVSVEERLSMSDLLKMRMATDIFVHVQTTDAGSRSVMEYVACNKKVIHGAWMKYIYLEQYHPSCYFPINQMEDLGQTIIEAYCAQIGPLPQEVMDRIMARGWKHRMALWNSFFESLI